MLSPQTSSRSSALQIPGTKEPLRLSLPRLCSERGNAPFPSRGLGRTPRRAGKGAGSLRCRGGEFPDVSSFASFATLLIEDLHVQFKKPSVGQAGKKGKTLLMRKGNLVPLSLPAGGHSDLDGILTPRLPAPLGCQPVRTHPRVGTGTRGGQPRVPPSSLLPARTLSRSLLKRLARLILHGLDKVLLLPVCPNPKPFLFPGFVNQPARHGEPGFLGPTDSPSPAAP